MASTSAPASAPAGGVIELEAGWAYVRLCIHRQMQHVGGGPAPTLTREDTTKLAATVHALCTQKAPHNHSGELYARVGSMLREYAAAVAAPLLQLRGTALLNELVARTAAYASLTQWLPKAFSHLERYHVPRHSLPSLAQVAAAAYAAEVRATVEGTCAEALRQLRAERACEEVAISHGDGEVVRLPVAELVAGVVAATLALEGPRPLPRAAAEGAVDVLLSQAAWTRRELAAALSMPEKELAARLDALQHAQSASA